VAAEEPPIRPVPEAAIELIKLSEGLRLAAYRDTGGVWTIGYGHTRNVVPGVQCSREQADAWLREDITDAARAVGRLVRVPLTAGEYGALVSFAYNVGAGLLRGSTLLRLLNAGAARAEVARQFARWIYDAGRVQPGLIRRREAERRLFLAADPRVSDGAAGR
jgi:lysozyme